LQSTFFTLLDYPSAFIPYPAQGTVLTLPVFFIQRKKASSLMILCQHNNNSNNNNIFNHYGVLIQQSLLVFIFPWLAVTSIWLTNWMRDQISILCISLQSNAKNIPFCSPNVLFTWIVRCLCLWKLYFEFYNDYCYHEPKFSRHRHSYFCHHSSIFSYFIFNQSTATCYSTALQLSFKNSWGVTYYCCSA